MSLHHALNRISKEQLQYDRDGWLAYNQPRSTLPPILKRAVRAACVISVSAVLTFTLLMGSGLW